MANTFTTNYSLTKPENGGANDTWGNLLNSDLDDLDSQVYNKVDKVDQKGVTHSLSFSGNNITTGTSNGFNSYVAGDRLYIANASSNAVNRGEFLIDNVVSDTELDLKKAHPTTGLFTTDAGFTTETISSVVYLVSIPRFTRQGLTQLTGEIKLYASVNASVIQALGNITYAAGTRYFWLPCNGDPVSRTVYDDLFAVIGTSFGDGDSSTTFNVPDLRGRTAIGTGTGAGGAASDADGGSEPTGGSALTARELGEWGGQETFALAAANLPTHAHDLASHTHSVPAQTYSTGSHNHLANPVQATLPQLNLSFGSSDYTHGGSGSGYAISTGGTPPTDHYKVRHETSDTSPSITTPVNTAAASTTNSGNTGTGNGLSNTALTFQQRAMPFLCVNYIIAT